MVRDVALIAAAGLVVGGCMVGPDYRSPRAPVAEGWLYEADPKVVTASAAPDRWWQVFDDPVLDALVDAAYRQNLSLQAAGLRVIQAQARRGIAIGQLFPQTQEAFGSYTHTHSSDSQVATEGVGDFDTYQAGFDASWELDFWGKFRRAIESADAELLAAVANYDDVLVSLVGEVAATYVRIRVLEEQLSLAHTNADIQRDSLEVASVRFESGGTSDLDVQQASSLLEDTLADIPEFEIDLRRAQNSLSVLLGIPPTDLADVLARSKGIPVPPPTVIVDIPAELLHRRPDLVRLERQLAAQSARIGVAKSDLFPQIELTGTVGLSSDQAAKFFQGRSLEAMAGPQFVWPVLNYGRIINAVRVEDATFQELVATYANTVLVAQREVEDAIVGYLRSADQVAHLERSVEAANRAVDISLIQYRGGATDYTSVLTAQQAKIREDRRLTGIRGILTLNVVALYKALGGGWELRTSDDFVPASTKEEMRERTWWGGMLETSEQTEDVQGARRDLETKDGAPARRWRWWWPQW
ncbi:MAG TPA: efflux transporter outer membrane subunit [Candidatus Binatia bacterium]|nr:efflux transporter outer membrane subunit [Candidatus Binatia bacterium]